MRKKVNRNLGFSLVELVVVIAIMAVLVSVLAPIFIRYVEKSRQGKDKEAAAVVQDAIKVAMADTQIKDRPVSFGPQPLEDIANLGTMPDFADAVMEYIGTVSLNTFSSDNLTSRAYKGSSVIVEINTDPIIVKVTVNSNVPGSIEDIIVE